MGPHGGNFGFSLLGLLGTLADDPWGMKDDRFGSILNLFELISGALKRMVFCKQ